MNRPNGARLESDSFNSLCADGSAAAGHRNLIAAQCHARNSDGIVGLEANCPISLASLPDLPIVQAQAIQPLRQGPDRLHYSGDLLRQTFLVRRLRPQLARAAELRLRS